MQLVHYVRKGSECGLGHDREAWRSVVGQMKCEIKWKKKKNTHIHEQRKPGDSLHGQNEERDHGKVSAVRVSFNPRENLLKGLALISVKSKEKV